MINIRNTELSRRQPSTEIPIEAVSKVEMFEVWFSSEAVAKCVASYFANAEIVPDNHGYFVRSLLLDKGTVLRILRKHHLRTDGFSVDTYWV